MIRRMLAVLALALALPASAQEQIDTSAGPVLVEPIVRGLDAPWAVAFLPGTAFLITERDGKLLLGDPAVGLRRVSGVPKVFAVGQGGLLDVAVARDFATSKEIFLSYAEPRGNGAGTALAVAKLDVEGAGLSDVRVIFRMNSADGGGRHFGSRIVESGDGTLYLTIGERGNRPAAQSLQVHHGKIVRVRRDGSIPADNPFRDGPAPEIWSFGHRNPQGAALDRAGRLWTVEHGAKGGDEVNLPLPGRNYGWPVISYGRHYSGAKIGEGTAKSGMEQPSFFWDPSIAPSGLMIYSGKLWPAWRGDMFVGSLKFDTIVRLDVIGDSAAEVERLFQNRFSRIRDVREAPDGTIWFLSVGDGVLYRARPG